VQLEPQATGLPFDLNTLSLQSRITVNLGKRVAQPTAAVEKRWW
jgi:hypothetical protein